ncbi:MAG: MarR family transcriptional regulator [Oscillospiraceae bacterium]|nr:MarR family transcriptional regulator [Oscillospiraceae bacterium]MBR6609972.1 MarR family transcriptional regulator [Oscillospiraceae bacterium]
MEKFKQDINTFLVDAFNSLLQIEEDFLAKGPFKNITVKEMHLIDTVVKLENNNIAKNIARKLNITQSSLTTAVSTLEKKGMLIRKSDERDKRIVKIYPTEKALQVYNHHRQFHRELVDVVTNKLNQQELYAFVNGLNKVREFFDSRK